MLASATGCLDQELMPDIYRWHKPAHTRYEIRTYLVYKFCHVSHHQKAAVAFATGVASRWCQKTHRRGAPAAPLSHDLCYIAS